MPPIVVEQPPAPPAYAPGPPSTSSPQVYYVAPTDGARGGYFNVPPNLAAAVGPRREPLRGTLGMTFGIAGTVADSAFNRAAALFGYEGFRTTGLVALDGGAHVTPWLMLGGRVGYGWSGAGRSPVDQASLMLHTVDAGALVRVGYPAPVGRTWWLFVGAQGTFGAMHAWTSLRGEGRTGWMPRGSAEAVLVATGARFGLSVRVGYAFANWGGLGTGGEGHPVGGVSFALGWEVRL